MIIFVFIVFKITEYNILFITECKLYSSIQNGKEMTTEEAADFHIEVVGGSLTDDSEFPHMVNQFIQWALVRDIV